MIEEEENEEEGKGGEEEEEKKCVFIDIQSYILSSMLDAFYVRCFWCVKPI